MRLFLFAFLIPFLIQGQVEPNAKKIHGVAWVSNREVPEKETLKSVDQIRANWICLIPFGFAKEKEPTVYFNSDRQWEGETPEGIRALAKNAKDLGYMIAIKPQLWIMNGVYTGRWVFKKEEDWEILENTYRTYILAFAKVAREENADLFIIGTELDAFAAARPEYWNGLIDSIRTIYKGPITYASNWDSYYLIPFWAQLDYFGVDAYFPISLRKKPKQADVERAWDEIMFDLEQFIEPFDLPILFTEYGYRSVTGGLTEPWDSGNKGEYNPEIQSLGIMGLYESVWNRPTFAGGFLWKWFDRPENAGGEGHTGFTPQNKPSSEQVRSFFKDRY